MYRNTRKSGKKLRFFPLLLFLLYFFLFIFLFNKKKRGEDEIKQAEDEVFPPVLIF